MVERLRSEEAVVVVAGENWDEANVEAVKAAQERTTFMVHPFDQVRWSSVGWLLLMLL